MSGRSNGLCDVEEILSTYGFIGISEINAQFRMDWERKKKLEAFVFV